MERPQGYRALGSELGVSCVNSGGFLGIRGALAGIAPDLVCLIMGVKQDKEA